MARFYSNVCYEFTARAVRNRLPLAPNEAELKLRDEIRAFLTEHQPDDSEIPADFDARVAFLRGWQRTLHTAGLIGLSWPAEHGGRGATLTEQIIANQVFAQAGAPAIIGSVGLDVVGPSLIDHGTEAQKSRFLERILSADDIWRQGFSEVGAGSDLASLKTKAVLRDGRFVISGHKVWTSYAQHAQWCAVLARTEPDAPAHKAISYLLVDMTSPGIEIRPLVQSTGDPEFSEVYFDDVEVAQENLLGALHGGWRIAMHTLTHERGWYGVGRQVILRVLLDHLIEEAGAVVRDGRPAIDAPEIRTSLAQAHIGLEVLKHQGYRSVSKMLAEGQPGLESSVDKVLLARVEQRLLAVALDVMGAQAALGDEPGTGFHPGAWRHGYFYARAASVYGGTEQIQKNIIAERILGLPKG
jgi:alkylation response protein AidB-like acyl-CoA dehydrogenase